MCGILKKFPLIVVIFITFYVRFQVHGQATKNLEEQQFQRLNEILASEEYDVKIRPGIDKETVTHVGINMYISEIFGVDVVNMDYQARMMFRQKWKDERLKDPIFDSLVEKKSEGLLLGPKYKEVIWVPDTYFENEKTSIVHKATVPNILLKLFKDGTILYSQRLTVMLSCTFHIQRFPFDNQTCFIKLMSYGYTTSHIQYDWMIDKENPFPLKNKSLHLPEYRFGPVSVFNCTRKQQNIGWFSCLAVEITMQRYLDDFMWHTYAPSVLIVMLSWVSFWIDHRSVAARISIGLLPILTLKVQDAEIGSSLPRVSYTKAVDVWMSGCMAFVFFAFVEYNIVTFMIRWHELQERRKAAKAEDKELEMKAARRHAAIKTDEETGQDEIPEGADTGDKETKIYALYIDVISRGLFPGMFVIFNIYIYGNYYRATRWDEYAYDPQVD